MAIFSIVHTVKRVKFSHTRYRALGRGADPGVQAVSRQVMWSESRHRPGSRLPLLSVRPAVTSATLKRAAINFAAWWMVNRGTMGVNSLPKTVTRQCRDCDLNPGPSAPESSMWLPSHPVRTQLFENVVCHSTNFSILSSPRGMMAVNST